jgi:hypothetical protein
MKTDEEYFAIRRELTELKTLVNQFMDTIIDVPFRAVDCDGQLAEELWVKLSNAVSDNAKDTGRTRH